MPAAPFVHDAGEPTVWPSEPGDREAVVDVAAFEGMRGRELFGKALVRTDA